MLKIETRLDPYEIDGKELHGLPEDHNKVIVRNHWNVRGLVVVQFGSWSFTVSADELHRAITNATNF